MSATARCPHFNFSANVKVARIEDTNIKYADITIICTDCGQPAVFRGMPFGSTPHHPTMRIDGQEVTLPFMVGDEEYDGKAIGFVGRRVL